MPKPILVVMAAGVGSRYGGMKQIEPVGPSGEIVLDYAVFDAVRAGFGKVVFVIRQEIEEAFREKIGKTIERNVDTRYAYQSLDKLPDGYGLPEGRSKPWGTAHAVLCAAEEVDAPFAVINADDFYGKNSFKVLHEYLVNARDRDGIYDYCMVGFELSNTLTEHGHVSRGVCTIGDDGYLEGIVERTKIRRFGDEVKYAVSDEHWEPIPADSVVSMNMWGFTPSYMEELHRRFPRFLDQNIANPKAEYFVPTVVNELIEEGKARVRVLPTGDQWFGVTYKEDRRVVVDQIAQLVKNGVYPARLWE
ncbi:MAG: nucleotidyltransferase [Chitinivibrionales bacterium]|nr:nucleotidyltransferase [Chitinivibrionales bacterium]